MSCAAHGPVRFPCTLQHCTPPPGQRVTRGDSLNAGEDGAQQHDDCLVGNPGGEGGGKGRALLMSHVPGATGRQSVHKCMCVCVEGAGASCQADQVTRGRQGTRFPPGQGARRWQAARPAGADRAPHCSLLNPRAAHLGPKAAACSCHARARARGVPANSVLSAYMTSPGRRSRPRERPTSATNRMSGRGRGGWAGGRVAGWVVRGSGRAAAQGWLRHKRRGPAGL